MGPSAEVDEGVLDGVARDYWSAFFLDELHLERLPSIGEIQLGVFFGHHFAFVFQIALSEFTHLRFDRLEVLRYERAFHDEVVEKAILSSRSNATLGTREQVGNSSRE